MLKQRLKFVALLGVLGGLGLTAVSGAEKDGAAGPDAVAKATGFAQYLPKTTQAYAGVFDGKGFLKELRTAKVVGILEKLASEQGGFSFDDLSEQPEAKMALSLFAEEFFIALGNGAGEQAKNFVALNEASTRETLKALVKMGDARLSGKEPDGPGGAVGGEAMMRMLFGGFLKDPAGGLPVLEKAVVPPLTLGFKVSDPDMRGQLIEMASGGLMQLLQQIGPDGENVAEEVKVKLGETEFTGLRIVGQKVAAKMNDDVREQMATMMDADTVDKLIKIIETKNIVIVVGTHKDYLIGFAGSDIADLQIAASPAESVLSRPELTFMNDYAGKKLVMMASMSQELQVGITEHSTLLGGAATGVKNGLAGSKSFGDTQDLEALLGLVAEQEKALFGMYSYTPAGVVVFLEDGLKVETYGGSNMADINLDAPRKYSSVGMADDIFLFANWVEDPAFTEKALEYIDTIGETLYLGAKGASKLEIEDASLAEFKEGFGMFDEKLRPHLLELWIALRSDMAAGLGEEAAIIMDLKGGLPTVPGLPQVVIDQGKAPRIGLLAPAADKERLAAAWKRIDKSAGELLKFASEMSGENIPMQRPMSSEKNDLKTWFFALPFQTDDFVLSVSVDKDHFFASTSKSFVQDLSAKLAASKVDESRTGAYFKVNLTLLHSYLNDWLKLLEENSDEIFGAASPASEDFKENLPMIREVLGAVGEIKGITGHTRKEDGTVRSSIHFETGN